MNNKILSFLLLVAVLLFLGSAFMVFNGCAASNTASVEEGVIETTSTTAPLSPGETTSTTTTTTTTTGADDGGGVVVITSTTAAEIVVVPTTLPEEVPWSGNPTDAPTSTVKLCFIHHSVGEQWLNDPDWDNAGGLGIALRNNNYFVSGTNYGWGPDTIGETTDLGNWWSWFRGPRSATYVTAVYANNDQNSEFSRLATNPGGENEIVMFKSCFPNSNLQNPAAPIPAIGSNPLCGLDAYSEYHTFANAKGIYTDLLNYFSTRQDKLFIAVTFPPLIANANAANARAFSNWLVNDWLASYPHKNVAVFDFYNIQTGGDNRHSYYDGGVHHV